MSPSFRPRAPRPGPAKSQAELDEIVRRMKAQQTAPDARIVYVDHDPICAKCGREFELADLHLLTVHHKDGNHNYNPPDGSNWENLCIYCHDDEHSRSFLGDYLEGNTPKK